jgi:flagellar assembly factor FliW
VPILYLRDSLLERRMSSDEILLTFPSGLIGFPDLRAFRLFEPSDGYPLKFLQSLEQPEISFVCMDAAAINLDYEVPLGDEDASFLALEKPEDALVMALVVVPQDPRQMTANLAGPLVVNARTKQGRQIQLDTRQYPLQYQVFAPKEDQIISFPVGLVGFQGLHSFRLFEPLGAYPLKFLQSVDHEEVSFTAIDVAAIKPGYKFDLNEEDAAFLALEKPENAMVLALVVIPQDPRQMTANLAGPIVINVQTRQGRQIILNTEKYPLKYPVITDHAKS